MLVLLDTSTGLCKLTLVSDDSSDTLEWQADRGLADGLLSFLERELGQRRKSWNDIKGVGVFMGPGSFTGLRIGIATMNAVANAKNVPIVGGQGDDWRSEVIAKLRSGHDDHLVMPVYGKDANITKPRK